MSDAINNFPPVIEEDQNGNRCDHVLKLVKKDGRVVYVASYGLTEDRADAAAMPRAEAIADGKEAISDQPAAGGWFNTETIQSSLYSDFEAVEIVR